MGFDILYWINEFAIPCLTFIFVYFVGYLCFALWDRYKKRDQE